MAKVTKTSTVTFSVRADKGKSVYVAGDFNEWNPTAKKMTYKAAKGVYAVTLKLSKGDHQYKFVIDGTWCVDPENIHAVPNGCGSFNSLVTVK